MSNMTVSKRQTKAAYKAWKTMRKAESLMTDGKLKALARQHTDAAFKKAWDAVRQAVSIVYIR